MKKNCSNEIAAAIKNYAKENRIVLLGNVYQTYSMLKYPNQNFPEARMFFSNNIHGKLEKKDVIIIALNSDTISHFVPDYVLERPKTKEIEYIPRMHRYNLHSNNLSLSF